MPTPDLTLCVDIGSTFTKAALVDLESGRLVSATSQATTTGTDVMVGVRESAAQLGAEDVPIRACSSAGGGLRIAVVGNEQLVTAEAGRLVALSSGGHVVAVIAGGLDPAALSELDAAAPDVILLVGGTDGGNTDVVLSSARALAGRPAPVVVACNAAAARDVDAVLTGADTPSRVAGNVMPRIGVLEPASAREAIRQVFLSHVIGGKHLSWDAGFAGVVRGATPDLVLRAVELLARGHGGEEGVGDLVLVDVGGATTDVYSVVGPTAEDGAEEAGETLSRQVLGNHSVTRTVEGDLGVRWSAPGTVSAAAAAGWLVDPDDAMAAAVRRRAHPGFVAEDVAEQELDVRLAAWALGIAVRRHAGRARVRYEATGPSRGRWVERAGVDLREVSLVVGSGGVLHHAVRRDPGLGPRFLASLDATGGWQVPRRAAFSVDRDYVWAAAGLLAEDRPDVAWSLLAPMRRALAPVPLR